MAIACLKGTALFLWYNYLNKAVTVVTLFLHKNLRLSARVAGK